MSHRMRALVLVVLVALAGAGCRKAGIVISSGATVASAVGGAALVARSEQGSTAFGAGTLLISYAIVGLTVTAGFVASVLEDRDSPATSNGEYRAYADDETGTDDDPSWSSSSDNALSSGASSGATSGGTSSGGATSAARVPRSDAYHYDRTGAPAGRHDANGNFYDRTGAPDGRVDGNGNFYDRTGAPSGRLDNSGNVYDRTGAPSGRIDQSGSYYDKTGAPAGRIDDSGNIYDRTGAPAGRVDSSCDAECRRAAVSRILLEGK